jgi:hypothetical protein
MGQQIREPITDLHSGDGSDGSLAPLELLILCQLNHLDR